MIANMLYYAYVVKSDSTNKIYIGQTENIEERLKRHNNLLPHKIKSYTSKNKGPWKLIHKEEFQTRKEAMVSEKQLKTAKGREFIKNLGS